MVQSSWYWLSQDYYTITISQSEAWIETLCIANEHLLAIVFQQVKKRLQHLLLVVKISYLTKWPEISLSLEYQLRIVSAQTVLKIKVIQLLSNIW